MGTIFYLRMPTLSNTKRIQSTRDMLPRRYRHPNAQTHAQRGMQDNPTPPPARVASPQPAPHQNKIRPTPFEMYKNATHQGRPPKGKTRHTTIHLKPRVRAELERKAQEEGLSISSTAAAIIEWFFTQSLYEQNAATIDTALDKGMGRHMKVHSDREASLLARAIQKLELLVQIDTQILKRQDGIDGRNLQEIMTKAHDAARASIKRTTEAEKQAILEEKATFEKGGDVK